jgi:hypothetical protein
MTPIDFSKGVRTLNYIDLKAVPKNEDVVVKVTDYNALINLFLNAPKVDLKVLVEALKLINARIGCDTDSSMTIIGQALHDSLLTTGRLYCLTQTDVVDYLNNLKTDKVFLATSWLDKLLCIIPDIVRRVLGGNLADIESAFTIRA